MPRASKFTDEQKFEIALDLISGKVSHAEVCRKYDISSTYAYKLKDRALDTLRGGIGRDDDRIAGDAGHVARTQIHLQLAAAVAVDHDVVDPDRPRRRVGLAVAPDPDAVDPIRLEPGQMLPHE